ncbi:hypothetical protein C1645_824271 [Glomus cerebriforme]|uniref:Uncharacterized protein n=1 Tax=Glomus cerebriforme TaxID=658196 RepID=A0A397SV12_9GLOM|nr:hypothetical protein C1645_824271 [Glomus cerebriforme]
MLISAEIAESDLNFCNCLPDFGLEILSNSLGNLNVTKLFRRTGLRMLSDFLGELDLEYKLPDFLGKLNLEYYQTPWVNWTKNVTELLGQNGLGM